MFIGTNTLLFPFYLTRVPALPILTRWHYVLSLFLYAEWSSKIPLLRSAQYDFQLITGIIEFNLMITPSLLLFKFLFWFLLTKIFATERCSSVKQPFFTPAWEQITSMITQDCVWHCAFSPKIDISVLNNSTYCSKEMNQVELCFILDFWWDFPVKSFFWVPRNTWETPKQTQSAAGGSNQSACFRRKIMIDSLETPKVSTYPCRYPRCKTIALLVQYMCLDLLLQQTLVISWARSSRISQNVCFMCSITTTSLDIPRVSTFLSIYPKGMIIFLIGSVNLSGCVVVL